MMGKDHPNNIPAFPKQGHVFPNGEVDWGNDGMSLRDYFAGQVLAGIYARSISAQLSERDIALLAYAQADEMIRQR